MLWLTAVAAGAFETALMLGRVPADEIAVGLVVRLTVFTVAVLVAFRMRSGARWARITLAVGLGVVGTASLVVEPLRYLLDGVRSPTPCRARTPSTWSSARAGRSTWRPS